MTRATWRHLADLRLILGGGFGLLLLLVAVFAPVLAPWPPDEQDLLNILQPPVWASGGGSAHLLGTDSLGRDVLSRLIWGARTAMTVAVLAAAGAAVLGCILGHLAGYFGGWVDWLIGRVIEIWLSFPPVVLSMLLIVGLGIGTDKVILAIILVDWTRFARVLRAEAQVTSRNDYVQYSRLIGFGHTRTLLREVFPASVPMLVTLFSMEMGIAVVVEAILSFVSMGVPATVPAWGQMIADARIDIYTAPWGLILPILAIFLAVLSFNMLGDGLRRLLDPRARAHVPV